MVQHCPMERIGAGTGTNALVLRGALAELRPSPQHWRRCCFCLPGTASPMPWAHASSRQPTPITMLRRPPGNFRAPSLSVGGMMWERASIFASRRLATDALPIALVLPSVKFHQCQKRRSAVDFNVNSAPSDAQFLSLCHVFLKV